MLMLICVVHQNVRRFSNAVIVSATVLQIAKMLLFANIVCLVDHCLCPAVCGHQVTSTFWPQHFFELLLICNKYTQNIICLSVAC